MVALEADYASFCLKIIFQSRFLHNGQAGLELLTSGDPPASTSQSAGIIGVSHLGRPCIFTFIPALKVFNKTFTSALKLAPLSPPVLDPLVVFFLLRREELRSLQPLMDLPPVTAFGAHIPWG